MKSSKIVKRPVYRDFKQVSADSFEGTIIPEVLPAQYPDGKEVIQVVEINLHFHGEVPQAFPTQYRAEPERDIFVGKRAAISRIGQWFWVIITLGIAYLFYWAKSLSTHFRITTQRIIITEGVFSTTQNVIELVRVDDFRLECPWTMRMLGYGILHITSSTPERSNVDLYGIKEIKALYEQIRIATIQEQRRLSVGLWKGV